MVDTHVTSCMSVRNQRTEQRQLSAACREPAAEFAGPEGNVCDLVQYPCKAVDRAGTALSCMQGANCGICKPCGGCLWRGRGACWGSWPQL